MKKDGFSLLEVLIIIFIIAVLIGVTVSSFNQAKESLALKRAAHQLVQDLRRAQEMAMSSKQLTVVDSGCLPLPAKGYGIYIDIQLGSDKKSYKLYADTTEDASGEWEYYNSGDCLIETINIQEKGVIIKEISNVGGAQQVSINFKPPNPNVKIKWLQSNEVRIILALESSLSKTSTIVINKAGTIEIE